MRVVVYVCLKPTNRWVRVVRDWLIRYAQSQSDALLADALALESLDRPPR
jgi:hypothetical protein